MPLPISRLVIGLLARERDGRGRGPRPPVVRGQVQLRSRIESMQLSETASSLYWWPTARL